VRLVPECRTGHYNLCRDVVSSLRHRSMRSRPLCDDPRGFRVCLPDHVSDDAGALCEPLSVGLWACRKRDNCRGACRDRGAGPIGASVTLVLWRPGDRGHRQRSGARAAGALTKIGATSVVDTSSSSLVNRRSTRTCSSTARVRRPPSSTASGACAQPALPCSSECARPRGALAISAVQSREIASPVRSVTRTPT